MALVIFATCFTGFWPIFLFCGSCATPFGSVLPDSGGTESTGVVPESV